MADSILRLKVESHEYDSKIQRAAKGLLEFENSCRKAGGTLAYLDKEEQDFVRSLGSMDTVSTTTRGKLNELTQAFTELSIQYKRLTDEEKKGDYGKALSASLEQLKGRIQETRSDLNGVSASLGDTAKSGNGLSQMLDGIAGKFGLNVGQLTKFGGALAAASAAVKVAKDTFMASEANIDEWGRTVRSAQDVYEGFLTSLNTGDVSGFLSRINDIISAARDAYTELDRLSTMKTINVPRLAEQQSENERLRAILRTGRQINRTDDATPAIAEGTQLTKQQLEGISKQLEAGLKNYNNIIREEIEQSNEAIEALYEEQADILGMSKEEFRAGTATMAELERRIALAKEYNKFEADHTTTTSYSNNFGAFSQSTRDNTPNPYAQYKGWDVFKDDGKLFQQLTQQIHQRASLMMQSYSNTASMYRQINRAQGVTPYSGSGGSTGTKEQTELQQNSEAIEKLKQEYVGLATAAQTTSESEMTAIRDRQTAIQEEIKTLQDRNAEIKRLGDEAAGIKLGRLPELNEQLKQLRSAQGNVSTFAEFRDLEQRIRAVNAEIATLTGSLPKGEALSFTVTVDADRAKAIMAELGTDKDIKVNLVEGKTYTAPVLPPVEQRINRVVGDTFKPAELPDQTVHVSYDVEDAPDIELDDVEQTLDIVVKDSEAFRQIAEMKAVTFDPKTVVFTANDVDVLRTVQQVQGVKIDDKRLAVIPETVEALKALADVQGLTIAPKSFPVTASTDEAMRQLQAVAGVTFQPKEVRVDEVTGETYTAPTLKPTEQVVNEVTGKTYTAPALPAVEQRINQVVGDTFKPEELPDQTIHVGYDVEDAPDIERDDVEQTLDIVVKDSEALRQIAEMKAVTFDPKTVVFTANDVDVLRTVQQVQGVKIDDKRLAVIPETVEALKTLADVQGLTIAPKSFPVTASTDEAMRQLQAVAGVTFQPKVVRVDEVTGKTYTAPTLKPTEQVVNEVTGDRYTAPTLPPIEQRVNQVAGDTYTPVELPDQTIHVGYDVEDAPDLDMDDIDKELDLIPRTVTVELKASTDAALQKVLGTTEGMARSDFKLQAPADSAVIDPTIFNAVNLDAKIKEIKQQLTQAEFGSDIYQSLTSQLADATALSNLISEFVKRGIDTAQIDGTPLWTKLLSGGDIAEAELDKRITILNDYLKEHGLKPLTIDVQTGNITSVADAGKSTAESWKSAAQAIQAVGGAISQIEDPAAKVAGTVAQAIAAIALGYAQAQQMAAAVGGPAGWIAFAATGLATMMTSITAIKNATAGSYERGGIVPGNSYSGDHLTASVNSGELILNRSQQDSIAAQLYSNSNGVAGGELTAVVTGEQLRLVLNRNSRRRGKGEYVTTNFM